MASTRWRVYVTVSYGGNSTSIGEVEMASVAAGTDLCTGGTAVADSVYGGGYEADKAFDNNIGTRWNNSTAAQPSWLEYQFASSVDIVEYRIKAPSDYAGAMPSAWTLQYYDGSTWVTVDTRTGISSWSTSESRIYNISAGGVGITKVQTTPAVYTGGFTLGVSPVFSSPPAIGNGIIFASCSTGGGAVISGVTDSAGNTYTLVKAYPAGGWSIDIYFCAAITATGSSFTVTGSHPSSGAIRMGVAYEIAGTLAVDKIADSTSGGSPTATSGTTAALTVSDTFVVAVVFTTSTVITVLTTSAVWTQDAEELSSIRAEIDSRSIVGTLGTTQNATWTLDGSHSYIATIVAFGATVASPSSSTEQTSLSVSLG